MPVRLAINGFGRTGRALLRSVLSYHPELEVVAVNDLGTPVALARLFARDSVHGRFPDPVTVGSPASCVFDSELTMAHGRLVKLLGWYDNESGYSSRLADLVAIVGAAGR